MPELWVPGAPAPSLEDLIARFHERVQRFAAEQPGGRVGVEVVLHDGTTVQLVSVSAEPGFGFVTLCPHSEEGEPEEFIVPVGSITRIRLSRPAEHLQFGFTAPPGR